MSAATITDELAKLRAENERLKARLYTRHYAHEDDDQDADDYYRPGCGADDTRDSKGQKLRPRVNEAGEPCWM